MLDRMSTMDRQSHDLPSHTACQQQGSNHSVGLHRTVNHQRATSDQPSLPLSSCTPGLLLFPPSPVPFTQCVHLGLGANRTLSPHWSLPRGNTSSSYGSLLSLSTPANSNHSGLLELWDYTYFPTKIFQQAIPQPRGMFYRIQLPRLLLKGHP